MHAANGKLYKYPLSYHSSKQHLNQNRDKINQKMSTLVNLLLAAVLNILGNEVPQEEHEHFCKIEL